MLVFMGALLVVPTAMAGRPPTIEVPDAEIIELPYNSVELGEIPDGAVLDALVSKSGNLPVNGNYEALMLPPNDVSGGGFQMESVIGTDGRVRVDDPTAFPFTSIVKLYTYWPGGYVTMGTGAIVGGADGHGFHVLTAGHCVYYSSFGWYTKIVVIPAYEGGVAPFNVAYSTDAVTFSGWSDYSSSQYDMALVTLDRCVGDYTGWMGMAAFDSDDPVYSGEVHTAGYPGDLYSGNYMYYMSADGGYATQNNQFYYMDTYGGQSGSPVWYVDDELNEYITTVHAYGTGGTSANFGTRINEDKMTTLQGWLASDTPPTNYANLIDDGQSFNGFNPSSVETGYTTLEVWQDVRNKGTASSGEFTVSYYLSTDSTITADDYLVASVVETNVEPFTFDKIEWSGKVPSSVPDGTYYLGWIIDSNDDVPELIDSGESDNCGCDTSGTIQVTAGTTEPPEPPLPTVHTVSVTAETLTGGALNSCMKWNGSWTSLPFEFQVESSRQRLVACPYVRVDTAIYLFDHWESGNGVELSEVEVLKVFVDGDLALKAVYRVPNVQINAMAYGQTILGVEFTLDDMPYTSPVEIEVDLLPHVAIAPEAVDMNGQTAQFLHWEDEEGNILRTRRKIRFRLRNDAVLNAIYQ